MALHLEWLTEFCQGPPAEVVSRSGLHAYVTKSSPLRRVSPTWVSPTRASCLLDSWTPGSPGCTPPTHTKTQPHIASNPSRSRSSTMPMPPSRPPPRPSSPRPWRRSGSPSFSCCARANTAVLRTTNPCAWAMSPSLLATRNYTPSRRPALTCTAQHMFPSPSTTRKIANGARSEGGEGQTHPSPTANLKRTQVSLAAERTSSVVFASRPPATPSSRAEGLDGGHNHSNVGIAHSYHQL